MSEVNYKWTLTGPNQFPPVFKIESVNGIIGKGKGVSIVVIFVVKNNSNYECKN